MNAALRAQKAVPALTLPLERFDLSCGARLLVSPRPGSPVTAVHVHLRGGPRLDPPGREGLAFLAGALADQGTRRRSETEIASLLEPAGGDLSGNAHGLAGTIAGGAWKILVDLICEELMAASYPKAMIERQKGRLLDRLLVEARDPRVQSRRIFHRLVYGDSWLGRPAHGFAESVAAIGTKDLRAHHRKHWVGARAIIGVCGDVDPRAVEQRFGRALREWRTGTALPAPESAFPPRASRVEAFPADRQQVHVYLGHLGVTRMHPDYPALVVMDHVLGTGPGFTNRISRRLRDELGLAYAVHADIHGSAGRLPGAFTAYIGTSPKNVATAVRGFLDEIHRIQDEPVGEDELEAAKSYLVGNFVLGFERAQRRASFLVSTEVYGFPDDYLRELPARFAEVTAADVQRVAREHLFPDHCCLSVAGPISGKEAERML